MPFHLFCLIIRNGNNTQMFRNAVPEQNCKNTSIFLEINRRYTDYSIILSLLQPPV